MENKTFKVKRKYIAIIFVITNLLFSFFYIWFHERLSISDRLTNLSPVLLGMGMIASFIGQWTIYLPGATLTTDESNYFYRVFFLVLGAMFYFVGFYLLAI